MRGPLPASLRLLLAALAFALGASPAAAETKIVNTPAEKYLIAPGGVDMRTGRYAYSETDLAIGGEGGGGLALTRDLPDYFANHANPFGNFSHNWDISLLETRVDLVRGYNFGGDYRMTVHYGGRAVTFESYGGVTYGFVYKSGGPSAFLTYSGGEKSSSDVVYTMRGGDGTILKFRRMGGWDCADQAWGSGRRRCAFVSEMTEPDGTRYSFQYAATGAVGGNTQRLRQVTSSRGYALLLEGTGSLVTRACVLNLAQTPVPASGLCPAGVPTATYLYSGARLASATGPGGGADGFTYSAQANGELLMGFVKPGQASPWLTNRIRLREDEEGSHQETISSQAFADGQSYTYRYTVTPVTNARPYQTIAGGNYTDAEGRWTQVPFDFPILPGTGPTTPCTQIGCPPQTVSDGMDSTYQQTEGPVKIVDPLGRTTILDYCDATVMAGAPSGQEERCSVLPLQSFTDPEGIRTALQYDGHRNVTRATRYPRPGILDHNGAVPAPIVTEAAYATSNPKTATKPLWTKDANGRITEYEYYPEHGGLRSETGPAPAAGAPRPQTRHDYQARSTGLADPAGGAYPPVWVPVRTSFCRTSAATGNPAAPCATAGDEVATIFEYGPDGTPEALVLRGQAVAADGITLRTCYGYDRLRRKVSETGPGANLPSCSGVPPAGAFPFTSGTRFDPEGRVTGTIAPDPDDGGPLRHAAVRNRYDPAGRLVKVEQGELAEWQDDEVAPDLWPGFTIFKTVDTAYDALDRKTREAVSGSGAVAGVTEYSYDLAGRPKCTAVRMNPDVWATPLPDKCVPGPAHSVHRRDRISRNVYDAAGQLVEVKDGVGTPLERTEATWTYNDNGQKKSLMDARLFRAEMTYDAFGRQSRWIFPSKTQIYTADPNDYEEYRYDPHGNRTWFRKRDGQTFAFDYDALNRMTIKYAPAGGTIRYSYDLRGLQTGAWFVGTGQGIYNSYDGFGRATSATSTMGGVSRTVSHLFDREGRKAELTFPDGFKFWFERDGLGRMTKARQGAWGTSGPLMASFGYNAKGLPQSFTRGFGDATSYSYDNALRLNLLTDTFVGGAGNVATDFTYNPASQLRSEYRNNDDYAWRGSVAVSRTYWVNGQNQYTGTASNGVVSATFTHDANGNLTGDGSTTFTYDSENRLLTASGGKTATLAYDPLGRLWQVTGPSGTTQFLYDGDELVAEYNPQGTLLRRYVHGDGADDPLFWYEGFDLTHARFPHADRKGSIVAIAGVGGGLLSINTYDEYGIPGSANQGRFQYTGQAWLAELGMYYYKARIYSPTLGRFLQTDPIGYDDQINLYAYVGNDPVNNTDPTGEERCPRGQGVCGFIRDFFVGDIEDAVADPTPVTIGMAVLTTVFKPAKVVDKVVDGARAAGRAKRTAETAERAANRAKSQASGVPDTRIGGSGKPVQHTVVHNTRKSAREAAERDAPAGGRARHDAHPTNPKQGPHFQAEGPNKAKVHPTVHHEHPEKK